jgi:hypothetical protein
MTRNAWSEPSPEKELGRQGWELQRQQFTPLAFRWREPDNDPDAAPLQNSWAQPSAPLEPFAYRLHTDGSLETKGHLDASGGAVSGTAALTLPAASGAEPSYRLGDYGHGDQFWHTVITTDDGSAFALALVFIDAITGVVTITWPAS